MEYSKVKLGDVSVVGDGAHIRVNRTESGVPYLTSKNIKDGFLDLKKIDYISYADYEKLFSVSKSSVRNLSTGDILVGIIGTFGNTYLYKSDDKFGISSSIGIIRPNPERIDSLFLYYQITSVKFKRFVEAIKGGSVQGYTNLPTIRKLPIVLPSLNLQKKIAEVLFTLDSKIELNYRIISNLEQLAQTLFKHWFVDFEFPNENGEPYQSSGGGMVESEQGKIPKGWKIDILGSIAEKVGNSIKVEELEKVIPYIGLEHMPRGSIALSSWETSEKITSNKTSYQQGDILFGKLRPYFKKVGFAPLDGICSTDIVVFNSKNLNYYSFLMCIVSRDDFIDYCNATATGTRMPRTGWNQMMRYSFVLPPEEVAKIFNEYISRFYERINELIHENINLKSLRDALLPKLLSGEIEFPDETEVAEHVSIP